MRFALKPSDKHTWLTVAATPSALWLPGGAEKHKRNVSVRSHMAGINAPRYPWEVTLTGCRPGAPHRMQGDVINHDELYAVNNGNKYLDYSVKHEVPIPLTEKDGKLAQEKLAAMLSRIMASANAVKEKIASGQYGERGWWEMRKTETLGDLSRRVKFLQRNAKGHRHPNGGGFVADNARVARTAYVGPNAMVLDGAQVKDNACIKEYAVVLGEKTVISGNARIGGKAWVCGDIKVGGNARILESATVTTIGRKRWWRAEGDAEITGSAVIKGEHYLKLCNARNQILTGGLVADYRPGIKNSKSGAFNCGRYYQGGQELHNRLSAGALYANWDFDQPKTFMLEDSYVNNNGILYGSPEFTTHDERKCIVFNGKDQYAEAPPSVADFGELTIDMRINWRGPRKGERVFDFGTGEDECFHLTTADKNGKLALVARHKGGSCRVTSSEVIPANKWVSVRVEMDGSEASIYIDGKRVAKGEFKFRPRDVFIGDRPEGNFIACARDLTGFFRGKMDHFRIYRKVHEDFSALGEVPFPLTQAITAESIEKARELSADWERRKKEKTAEAYKKAGHDEIVKEIKELNDQKRRTESKDDLAKITARIAQLGQRKSSIFWATLRAIGGNPYTPMAEGERIMELQQNLVYHTTADWDYRTPEEVKGKVTPAMKKWLERVRGY